MQCPYCHKKSVEVSRDEMLYGAGYYGNAITIVYKCTNCGKEPLMRLEFEGWYDEDDCSIPEQE